MIINQSVAIEAATKLARVGIRLSSSVPFGCGFEGCVYPAGHGVVVKLTGSELEAQASDWIRQNNPGLSFLPKILDVHEFLSESGSQIFAITREDLADGPEVRRIFVNPIIKRLLFAASPEDRRLKLDQVYKDGGLLLSEIAIVRNVDQLARWSEAKGIQFRDVKVANIGWRGNQPVLRDLGFVFGFPKSKSQMLSGKRKQ